MLWVCPQCLTSAPEGGDLCRTCGTSLELPETVPGVGGVSAPLGDELNDRPWARYPDELQELPSLEPAFVGCFETTDPDEARIVADLLIERGIHAVLRDEVLAGGAGTRTVVLVPEFDLHQALEWTDALDRERPGTSGD
jgi:hypothetical protein